MAIHFRLMSVAGATVSAFFAAKSTSSPTFDGLASCSIDFVAILLVLPIDGAKNEVHTAVHISQAMYDLELSSGLYATAVHAIFHTESPILPIASACFSVFHIPSHFARKSDNEDVAFPYDASSSPDFHHAMLPTIPNILLVASNHIGIAENGFFNISLARIAVVATSAGSLASHAAAHAIAFLTFHGLYLGRIFSFIALDINSSSSQFLIISITALRGFSRCDCHFEPVRNACMSCEYFSYLLFPAVVATSCLETPLLSGASVF